MAGANLFIDDRDINNPTVRIAVVDDVFRSGWNEREELFLSMRFLGEPALGLDHMLHVMTISCYGCSMTYSDDDLLTPDEVAAMLRIAVSTLIRWRRETRKTSTQHGPYWVVIGHRTVAYRRSAVTRYIDSREHRADG